MSFDVAVKPKRVAGEWILGRVVVAGRPPLPSSHALEANDGVGFRHESAWLVEEFLTAHKWVGRELTVVYNRIRSDVGDRIRAADPGNPADVMTALNDHFYLALCQAGENVHGHHGPTMTHAAPGGRIRGVMRKFDRALGNWDELALARASIQVYLSTFEVVPEIARLPEREARREHVQKMNELFAEYGLDPETILWVHSIIAEYWGLAKPQLIPAQMTRK